MKGMEWTHDQHSASSRFSNWDTLQTLEWQHNRVWDINNKQQQTILTQFSYLHYTQPQKQENHREIMK